MLMVWVKTKSVYGVLEQFSQGTGMQKGLKIHHVDDGYLFIYLCLQKGKTVYTYMLICMVRSKWVLDNTNYLKDYNIYS